MSSPMPSPQRELMRAVVQDAYGSPDALALREIPVPTAGDGEVLVRVRAASLHPDVWHVVTGRPYVLRIMGSGLRRPKNRVPGTDLAGVVESVGAGVTGFGPGDEVFGEIVRVNQWRNAGAYAEFAAVSESLLEPKPAGVTFEEAAAVPTSALIALRRLRDEGRVQAGQTVLVNGAGGGVGVFAVQIAKALGATVTAVDSTEKLEMLRSIGAERVIDYTEDDFARSGDRWDIVFDVAGNHPWSVVKRAITEDGTYVLIGHDHFGVGGTWFGSLGRFAGQLVLSPFVRQLPGLRGVKGERPEDLATVAELIDTGRVRPVVGRTFPLSEVREAIRSMSEGHTLGKIVITI